MRLGRFGHVRVYSGRSDARRENGFAGPLSIAEEKGRSRANRKESTEGTYNKASTYLTSKDKQSRWTSLIWAYLATYVVRVSTAQLLQFAPSRLHKARIAGPTGRQYAE